MKSKQSKEEKGKGEKEEEMGCSSSRRSWCGEGEAGATMVGPIYRPAMLVLVTRYFSPAELTRGAQHMPISARSVHHRAGLPTRAAKRA